MIERTLSIIKPDATSKNIVGKIISRFEANNLRVAALRKLHLNKGQAEKFYEVHKDRPFFTELVIFMTSGPIVAMVLEGENAIAKNRELMGDTDPKKAAKGSIRADFASSIEANAVHGSDSQVNARVEIDFFFKNSEIF